MTQDSLAPRPIVIVTGANGGVGYGVCQRLLMQLSLPNAPDALPQSFASSSNVETPEKPPTGHNGLTLIMACRNVKRAEAARSKLVKWLDNYVADLILSSPHDQEYITNFHAKCDIQVQELDLASVKSTLAFAAAIQKTVPYVSHLLCIAGVASFSRIDWPKCIMQLLRDRLKALTAPEFYLQRSGETSTDDLGWVWQCNVFGHFVLARELEPLLAKTPFDNSRVIWCSSLEASPKFYNSKDWQLRITEHSYESSKYQIDLIATILDQRATRLPGKQIRHFIGEPGTCSTSISQELAGPILDIFKVILFYIGRLCGTPHHTIDPLKAAISSIHLMLVPLCFLAVFDKPVRYGSFTWRLGAEYVGISEVKEWDTHKAEGEELVGHCEELYQTFKAAATS